MSFTEAQTLRITRITGIQTDLLSDILTMRSAAITTEVETQVGDLILEWFPSTGTGAGRDFVKIEAKDRNFGANIDPARSRAAIRKEIGDLLYLTEYMQRGAGLVRC